MGLNAIVKNIPEYRQPKFVTSLLKIYKPDILIITGHDEMLNKNRNFNDLYNYRNSRYFINTVKEARKYENSHEKLIIIAGGCSSYYEELIRAGANFASSPKRINIHALDPAIVATKMSLSDINKDIDSAGTKETIADGIEKK